MREELRTSLSGLKSLVVVGIGSVLRSDDACGVVFLDGLAERLAASPSPLPNLTLINGSTAVESVTGAIIKAHPSHVLFVDAADLGLAPGSVQLIPDEKIVGITFSTHMLPLRIVIDYLHQSLPETRMLVLGIQPESLEFCADIHLSSAVDGAVRQLVDALFFAVNQTPRAEDCT